MGADLTYLNFVVGVLCMFSYQPVQDWLFRRGTLPEISYLTIPQMPQNEAVDLDRKPDS